jgi:hypothetical protein
MLRNVLEDYLSSVRERDFYYPLTSLLQAMGVFDIHITDGPGEFGKDFIAKRIEHGATYQYKIQAKKGDINQQSFRDNILGQLLEAIVLKKLSHPQLDTSLPQKTILVTTSELTPNAFIALQELNGVLENEYKKEKVEFWGKNNLIEFSEQFGLIGIHQTTAKGLRGYGEFYLNYSKSIDGSLSDREIEEYSRLWLDEDLDYRKRILRAAIEAEIIAAKLFEGKHLYEAIVINLSLARTIMQVMYENDDPFVVTIFEELREETILPLCRSFFNQFKAEWEGAERFLDRLCFPESYFPVINYLVWCARILEIVSLYFFLTKDQAERDEAISFIIEFIEKEQGSGHIPGDRYAVSTVWPALALIKARRTDEAINFIKKNVIWLCDRVDDGLGLARYDAEEYEETAFIVGAPFDFIEIEKNQSSYLATALADLAAFIGNQEFYADVVNDIEASEIAYNYWQLPDTQAVLTISTEEIIFYPNNPHQFSLNNFEDFEYAEHIKHESDSYTITQKAGESSLILLSILLKDRYFPKMWRPIVSEDEAREPVGEAAGQPGA